jgi:hypothetical protein
MRRLVLLAAGIAACALPAVASAATTYTATFTFDSIGGGHTYNIAVDCASGAYTGTGDVVGAYTGGEAVAGTLTSTSNVGTGSYNAVTVGSYPGYAYTYSLASSNGANYLGSITDNTGAPAYTGITSTVSNSTRATVCLPHATSKDQCKNYGWQTVSRADYTTFKNQGDCVSYVENGK